jgi:hypothetical protein
MPLPASALRNVEVKYVGHVPEGSLRAFVEADAATAPDDSLVIYATHPMSVSFAEKPDGTASLNFTLQAGLTPAEVAEFVRSIAYLHDNYNGLTLSVTDLSGDGETAARKESIRGNQREAI